MSPGRLSFWEETEVKRQIDELVDLGRMKPSNSEDGKFERVIAYASKSLTAAHKKFHPMEGECYALIWGVMHF